MVSTAHIAAAAAETISSCCGSSRPTILQQTVSKPGGPISEKSYDLSKDYLKFIVKSTYDSDLRCAMISLRNIVRQLTNTISNDLRILQVNRTQKSLAFARHFVN